MGQLLFCFREQLLHFSTQSNARDKDIVQFHSIDSSWDSGDINRIGLVSDCSLEGR